MGVEVKKRGRLEIRCQSCGAVLTFNPSDVKQGSQGGNYLENGAPMGYIDCPCCKALVVVSDKYHHLKNR